jgi:perosamine synthetase
MSSEVPFITLSTPNIRGNEWKYVKECLDTAWVSTVGPYVARFEAEFSAYLGARKAVACQSGTAALHVALLVAGVKAGDEVLVPTLTFIAPANAILYAGGIPVLVDVDARQGLMDLDLIEGFLRQDCERRDAELFNRRTGARVAAILPVHVLGHPLDMNRLVALAEEFSLAVIEDATESLGSRHDGRATGTIGHIGCFSFNGNKIMTTGGGGMIVTDNEAWAHRAKHLTNQAKVDPVEYKHDEVGYNYRLTNVQAAMGVAQLEQMGSFMTAKQRIADRYRTELARVPGISAIEAPACSQSNWWLFTVRVDERAFGHGSRSLMSALAERNIQSRPLWRPLHMGAPHANRLLLGDGSVAENFYRTSLSLPCSTHLTEAEQTAVVHAIQEIVRP